MAHMYPTNPEFHGGGSRAERVVFEALRDQLDDDYFVYSRLEYIDDDKYSQGEADFLILHRTQGMLFLECKGEGVRRTGTGQWQRKEHGHWKKMHEGPFEQAERTKYELVDKLEPRVRKHLHPHHHVPFVYGHAVIFPFAHMDESALPLHQAKVLLFDADSLKTLAKQVGDTLAFWRAKAGKAAPGVPSPAEFKKFRKRILLPAMEVIPDTAGRIHAEEEAMVRLTRDQQESFRGLLDNERFRIEGGAGTGKTVLAMEAARRFAEEGDRVLVLCFNSALRNYLAGRMEGWHPEEGDEGGQVKVNSFHKLAAHASYALGRGKLSVPADKEEKEAFWRDDAPLVLVEALEAGKIDKYDAIVVDEGQDFAASWWDVLEMMLKDSGKGRIFAFYDASQEIFGRGVNVPAWPRMKLKYNFRNTRSIAKVLNDLGHTHMKSHSSCPAGEEPVVKPHLGKARTLQELEALVKELLGDGRLLPDQVTILTPHRTQSTLEGVTELAGVPLAHKPGDRHHKILHTTIGAFKGLESDVLILLDVDPSDPRCDSNARYVAASRARHRLYVFSKGDWLS